MIQRKEFLVSTLALGYLQSRELEESFCGDCPWNEYFEGYFNEITGMADPPHEECLADFDLTSDDCRMKSQFTAVVEALEEADRLAGIKREVRIVL